MSLEVVQEDFAPPIRIHCTSVLFGIDLEVQHEDANLVALFIGAGELTDPTGDTFIFPV